VETEQQLALLSDMGCEVAQGYYFSKPVEAEAFSQLMIEKGVLQITAGLPNDRALTRLKNI